MSTQLHLLSPRGFRAGSFYAGIKSRQTPDVALLVGDAACVAAAVFTTNKVQAAPILVGQKHVATGRLRAVVVNAGNANACTGRRGLADANTMCALAAKAVGCDAAEVLPSSTGIIGHLLPMDKVAAGIAGAYAALGDTADAATSFADAICTTDTRRKVAGVRVKIGRQFVTIAGVCKGAGMIGPRLGPPQATMLAYLTTDAAITPPALRSAMWNAAEQSFNAVTIDDHTSTNDTAAILASGASGVKIASAADKARFAAALEEVCRDLAVQIAADGEGATKVVEIRVVGAASVADARAMARNIANSPLVKCAMHGNDPNWGRIVSAAGYADAKFDPDRATLVLAGTAVFRNGQPTVVDKPALSKKLAAPRVVAELRCGLGKAEATVYTCDLSKDYVTINADYHT